MKEKGILLPIFSLPSKYGVGDFGYEAYEFIDILSENEITYWQILPINACVISPYSTVSYYALNEYYISLDKLKEMGLISELKTRENKNRAIYDNFKERYYKNAYKKFNTQDKKYKAFIKMVEINHYAEYMSNIKGECKEYYLFLQYILYKQWMELKEYANSKKVKIIGDIPAYPTFDSAETRYNSQYFEMKNGKFTFEAGAPPDCYNSEGQRWGCPVYNIKHIKKDNYSYFLNRFEYFSKLFDKIRIDYFRGYDSFYKVPINGTIKEGLYSEGLGYRFFDNLFTKTKVKVKDLIIEDIGDIRKETVELRNRYKFTRQKILQYSIDLKKMHDMDNEDKNVVVFPGTHDCNTIYGWYKSLSIKEKRKLKEFLKINECDDININIGIIQYCLKCKAKIAIVQAQDILGLDGKARTNRPGTVSYKNWSWKLNDFNDFKERIKDFNII